MVKMKYQENFSGSFSNQAPERNIKVVNPGKAKSSAIEDLKKIGMGNNFKKNKKINLYYR